MKVKDFFIVNKKEINALKKLKLPLKKSTEQYILQHAPEKGTEYYSIIQNYKGKILERVFAVRSFRKKPEYQEVIRRIEGNGLVLSKNMYFTQCSGYVTVWRNSKPSYYYFNMEYFNEWCAFDQCYFHRYSNKLYTLKDLIELDPSLKYCAWNGDHNQNIIDYVTIYRKYPEIEMLSKLGLDRLIYNQNVLDKLKDKSFQKYLCKCGGNHNTTGKDVLYGFNHNMTLEQTFEHQKENITKRRIGKQVAQILEIYPQLDKERLRKYLSKYLEQKGYFISIGSYLDMLEAETFLHLDLTEEKNAFPHDFEYWHNHYTNQMKISKNKLIDEGIAAQVAKYQKLEKEVKDLKLILATSSQELINEGEALHHCVGRMNYNKKMAKGESLILFVRKKEDMATPFVTMEYDPNQKKILQLYGERDSVPEDNIKNIIYDSWLPKVRRLKFI